MIKNVVMKKLIESKGFSAIISNLFTDCDVFEPDPSLREDYEIGSWIEKSREKNFIRNKISLSLIFRKLWAKVSDNNLN